MPPILPPQQESRRMAASVQQPLAMVQLAMPRDAEHTRCMPTSIHLPIAADEQLVRAAMLRAGAQVHSTVGIVAMYRSVIQDSPKTARLLERKLRQFMASGKLGR